GLALEVDRELEARESRLHELLDLRLRERDRDEADLHGVREEDVAERRGDHDVEAVVLQRPGGMLARRPASEVRTGEKDSRAVAAGPVQLEIRVLAPVEEEKLAVAGPLDPLEELLRDDLVGVDVGPVEHGGGRRGRAERLHAATPSQSRTSTKWPAIAAAAAMTGLTRCVRPPRPCRPSKFRLDVDAQRSPAPSTSGFMPRHMEQPARRHSNPACSKTRSRPSSSAWRFTVAEPGTTIARTRGLTRFPATTPAAARRSSIRAFVHEPMKTRSRAMSRSATPGSRSM